MMRVGFSVFLLLACSQAVAKPVTGVARLACADVQVIARSVYDPSQSPDDGTVWLQQNIEITGTSGSVTLPSERGQTTADKTGKAGLSAFVASWVCVQGSNGAHYLWLDYGCARDQLDGVCHGEKEWLRLFSLDGRKMDAGYMPQDPRYEDLYRKLGVKTNGVQMESAVPLR